VAVSERYSLARNYKLTTQLKAESTRGRPATLYLRIFSLASTVSIQLFLLYSEMPSDFMLLAATRSWAVGRQDSILRRHTKAPTSNYSCCLVLVRCHTYCLRNRKKFSAHVLCTAEKNKSEYCPSRWFLKTVVLSSVLTTLIVHSKVERHILRFSLHFWRSLEFSYAQKRQLHWNVDISYQLVGFAMKKSMCCKGQLKFGQLTKYKISSMQCNPRYTKTDSEGRMLTPSIKADRQVAH
jgi:hypothetical protein